MSRSAAITMAKTEIASQTEVESKSD